MITSCDFNIMGICHNAYIITYCNRASKIPHVNFSNDTSSFTAAEEANYAAIRQRNGQVLVKALNVNGEDGHQNRSRLVLFLIKSTLFVFFVSDQLQSPGICRRSWLGTARDVGHGEIMLYFKGTCYKISRPPPAPRDSPSD